MSRRFHTDSDKSLTMRQRKIQDHIRVSPNYGANEIFTPTYQRIRALARGSIVTGPVYRVMIHVRVHTHIYVYTRKHATEGARVRIYTTV